MEITVRAPSVDASTGPEATSPVVAATVSALEYGRSIPSDAAGIARLRGLPPGRTTIRVSALGYETAEVEVVAINGRITRATVSLSPAPIRLAGVDVTLEAVELPRGGISVNVAQLPPTVVDLPGAIDRLPGATVVRQGGPGSPAVLQLRGSGGDQVLVLLDGVPINSPLTGVADLSTVDLASIDRVTVLPGAQSSRYGPRALGGVVLLETRPEARSSVRGTIGGGAWGSREADLSGSWVSNDTWSVSGGLRWARARGDFLYEVPDFRGGGETARDNADFRRIGSDVQLTRTGPIAVSARLNASELERGSPGTIAQPSLSGIQHHRRWGAGVSASFDDPDMGGSVRTATQWQRAEYRDPSPPFGAAYDSRNDVWRGGLAAEGWWSGTAGALSAGVDAARMTVESNVLDAASVDVDEIGVWARLERTVDVGNAGRLRMGAGLRVDGHDLVDDHPISPSIDVRGERGPVAIEVAWARGFAPPGLGDLFFQEGVLVEPNPDLLPERVTNEVSATLALRASPGPTELSVRTSAYRADVDDMILWFPDFRFIWSPNNFDVERRGLEVGADLGLAVGGRTHSIAGSVHWSRVEYTGDVLSGQVVYRPDVSADATLTLELPFVSVAPTAGWIGERRSVPGSELNSLPAYWLVDVGFAVPFESGALSGQLDMTLSNLLDERAALLVDYPLPSRGWSMRLRLVPG